MARKMWGMKLGRIVNTLRSGNSYKDHKEELASIGFSYDKQPHVSNHGIAWETLKLALETFMNINGDLIIDL
jgi:hypothetical protein